MGRQVAMGWTRWSTGRKATMVCKRGKKEGKQPWASQKKTKVCMQPQTGQVVEGDSGGKGLEEGELGKVGGHGLDKREQGKAGGQEHHKEKQEKRGSHGLDKGEQRKEGRQWPAQ